MAAERWADDPDAADLTTLIGLAGPVLDIGCGPGRMVRAALDAGLAALGVDVSAAAVAHCRDAGLPVLHRSVFDRMPHEGRWWGALLLDGNIGIGGDVAGSSPAAGRCSRSAARSSWRPMRIRIGTRSRSAPSSTTSAPRARPSPGRRSARSRCSRLRRASAPPAHGPRAAAASPASFARPEPQPAEAVVPDVGGGPICAPADAASCCSTRDPSADGRGTSARCGTISAGHMMPGVRVPSHEVDHDRGRRLAHPDVTHGTAAGRRGALPGDLHEVDDAIGVDTGSHAGPRRTPAGGDP